MLFPDLKGGEAFVPPAVCCFPIQGLTILRGRIFDPMMRIPDANKVPIPAVGPDQTVAQQHKDKNLAAHGQTLEVE